MESTEFLNKVAIWVARSFPNVIKKDRQSEIVNFNSSETHFTGPRAVESAPGQESPNRKQLLFIVVELINSAQRKSLNGDHRLIRASDLLKSFNCCIGNGGREMTEICDELN